MFRSLIPRRERSLSPMLSPRAFGWFEGEMDELMDRLFRPEAGWPTSGFEPSVNLVEKEGLWEVTADLPGLKPEDVTVEFKDDQLWISGKREEEKEEKEPTYHRMERRYGEFRRVLPLPKAVDANAIEAKFENGVLTVSVPKSEETKPKHIEVKA
jgi:HSP20 family protein